MKKPHATTFTSRVDARGRLRLPYPEALRAFRGKSVVVYIEERPEKTRTASQNAYYRGVIIPYITRKLQADIPDRKLTEVEVHDFIKRKFLGDPASSTTDLTVSEFSELIETLKARCMERFGEAFTHPV